MRIILLFLAILIQLTTFGCKESQTNPEKSPTSTSEVPDDCQEHIYAVELKSKIIERYMLASELVKSQGEFSRAYQKTMTALNGIIDDY